jgi:hypothetical protein
MKQPITDQVLNNYARARENAPMGEFIVLLLIGLEVSWVAIGTKSVPSEVFALGIGAQRLAREQFRNIFPRELELEGAISTVEDEVMKNWPLPAGVTHLVVFDSTLYDVALASAHNANPYIELDLDAVERLFSRLVASSYGSSESQQGIPKDAVFAAKLLILREFLHHKHFRSVSLGSL